MTDELDRVRELRPSVAAPSPQLVETERNRLMTVAARESLQEADASNPRRKRRLLQGLAFVALATAAAGWAATRDVGTSTEVACANATLDAIAVIDAVSGDPVADCTEVWQGAFGTEPPELIAYDNRAGGVMVVPVGAEVPGEWTPLAPDFSQDARLIELDAALGDYGDGLSARCYELEDAKVVAERALERLGLDDWSVLINRDRDRGDAACAVHGLEPEVQQIVIFPLPMEVPPKDAPSMLLAAAVHEQVDGACLTREQAVATVGRIADDLGFSQETGGGLNVHSLEDVSAACSRTDVNVGGGIEVTVRGPDRRNALPGPYPGDGT